MKMICRLLFLCFFFYFHSTVSYAQNSSKINRNVINETSSAVISGNTGSKTGGTGTQNLDFVFGSEATTKEIFGMRGGYLHPFLSTHVEYTDNLYDLNFNKTTNLLTVISPGIWFGLPRISNIPVTLTSSNSAVGGQRYSIPERGVFDHFQTYLLAGLDYKHYSANSDLNHLSYRLEGLYQYNMPAGISFRFLDQLTRDEDRFDIGSFLPSDFTLEQNSLQVTSTPSRIRQYYSNIADISVNFDMTGRLTALFNYTNFALNYIEDVNNWLNRTDHDFSLAIAYEYSPKTSFFMEYSFADTAYTKSVDKNSRNTFIYAGINWKGSSKLAFKGKAGYQLKSYATLREDTGMFSTEMQMVYLMTEKTKLSFRLYKALEEPNSSLSSSMNTLAATLRYDQALTHRIRFYNELIYEQNSYDNFVFNTTGPRNSALNDHRYTIRPAVQYMFRDWLTGELAYSYENRDSNDQLNKFKTQTFMFSLNSMF